MASRVGGSVTVDRVQFETLVNRANFNADPCSQSDFCAEAPDATIFVSKAEYNNLQQIAQNYANLQRNLLRGGIGEDTISLLSKDDATIQRDGQQDVSTAGGPVSGNGTDAPSKLESGWRDTRVCLPPQQPSAFNSGSGRRRFSSSGSHSSFGHGHRGYGNGRGSGSHRYAAQEQYQDVGDWNDGDGAVDEDEAGCVPDGFTHGRRQSQSYGQGGYPMRPVFERNCMRTVQLLNIPDVATHADITAAVRGGLLLDIYLRGYDRSVLVSFLNSADALAFFEHVKRHDLYIKNKRIDIRWGDRQFILPAHVANKIGVGATRNLVIRRCDTRITEDMVREDLDHIHNLVVIKVEFGDGNCYISTNSVHNALFARTCMMSRALYKGSRIEWFPDECAQPIEQVVQAAKPRKSVKKPAVTALANRFQLLDMNAEDTESTDSNGEDNNNNGGVDMLQGAAVGFVEGYGRSKDRPGEHNDSI